MFQPCAPGSQPVNYLLWIVRSCFVCKQTHQPLTNPTWNDVFLMFWQPEDLMWRAIMLRNGHRGTKRKWKFCVDSWANIYVMALWHGNIFCNTGPWGGKFTGQLKTFLRKVDKCITRIHNYWWHNHNKQSTTKTCTLFHWINCTCMSCINCATVLYQITESDRALTSSATVALKTI